MAYVNIPAGASVFDGDGLTADGLTLDNDLITGVAGGQTIKGGTAAGDDLIIVATAHASPSGAVSRFGHATAGINHDQATNKTGVNCEPPSSAVRFLIQDLGTVNNVFEAEATSGSGAGNVVAKAPNVTCIMGARATVGGTFFDESGTGFARFSAFGSALAAMGLGTETADPLVLGTNNLGRLKFYSGADLASGASVVWDSSDFKAATLTITGNTNITTATGVNAHVFRQPTLSAAQALTVTASATVYIADAPAAAGAGPATITTAYALWIDAGLARFDGNGTHVFLLPADATDPTGGGGAATGRIPVSIGGATRYLAYY